MKTFLLSLFLSLPLWAQDARELLSIDTDFYAISCEGKVLAVFRESLTRPEEGKFEVIDATLLEVIRQACLGKGEDKAVTLRVEQCDDVLAEFVLDTKYANAPYGPSYTTYHLTEILKEAFGIPDPPYDYMEETE